MLLPSGADRLGSEEALLAEPPLVEQRLGPLAKRITQPGIDRYAEAHLGTVDQLPGNVAIEHAPQRRLAGVAGDLHRERQSPGKLDHAVIERSEEHTSE